MTHTEDELEKLRTDILYLFPRNRDYPYTNLGEVTDQILSLVATYIHKQEVALIDRLNKVLAGTIAYSDIKRLMTLDDAIQAEKARLMEEKK